MALTEPYTRSPTVGTSEYSIVGNSTGGPSSSNVKGSYQLFLDVNALAAGDEFEVALYEKVTSSGTQRLVKKWTLQGVQGSPIWATPGMMLYEAWDFTLKKLSGTDRQIFASVRQAA